MSKQAIDIQGFVCVIKHPCREKKYYSLITITERPAFERSKELLTRSVLSTATVLHKWDKGPHLSPSDEHILGSTQWAFVSSVTP